jgi:hypothetical protein
VDIFEKIIFWHTLNTDKGRVGELIKKEYSYVPEIMAKIGELKGISAFKEFGRLSQKLLCEIVGGEDEGTGEVYTILNRLYHTNDNLNQLLHSEQYHFAQEIKMINAGEEKDEVTDEDVEKAFMYLTYDDQTYLEAKEYLLSCDYYDFDSKAYRLNDYVFYEDLDKLNSFRNDGFFEKYDIPESEYRYPRWYNMVGFSDKANTIMFLNASKFRAIDSFEEHVKAYYGEWYDFS